MVSNIDRKHHHPHSSVPSNSAGGAVLPGAEHVNEPVVWDMPLGNMGEAYQSSCCETDESVDSSTNCEIDEENVRQGKRKLFWKSKGRKSSTPGKATKKEPCTVDHTPHSIEPDLECGEDPNQRKAQLSFGFLCMLASSFVLLAMVIAIGASVACTRRSSQTANSGSGSVEDTSPAADNIFDQSCDVFAVETKCRNDQQMELDLQDIPKCIQDGFDLVYVRAGHDAYYQLNSISSLKSCSNEGMALKRIAAMEHERESTGMLDCQFTAYSWYYGYGEIDWWTQDGAILTGACNRDYVSCTGGVVESFVTEMGEECLLSALSL